MVPIFSLSLEHVSKWWELIAIKVILPKEYYWRSIMSKK